MWVRTAFAFCMRLFKCCTIVVWILCILSAVKQIYVLCCWRLTEDDVICWHYVIRFSEVPAWGRHVTECIAQSVNGKESQVDGQQTWSVSTHTAAPLLQTNVEYVFFLYSLLVVVLYSWKFGLFRCVCKLLSSIQWIQVCVCVSNDITIFLDFVLFCYGCVCGFFAKYAALICSQLMSLDYRDVTWRLGQCAAAMTCDVVLTPRDVILVTRTKVLSRPQDIAKGTLTLWILVIRTILCRTIWLQLHLQFWNFTVITNSQNCVSIIISSVFFQFDLSSCSQ